MTEPKPAAAATASTDPAQAQPPAEWKPEPRQWTWKDLFTAPMLAFKPKAMAVSALTLLVLGVWAHLYGKIPNDLGYWQYAILAGFVLVGLAIFGLGATFVAGIMKADLLDDEFLSFSEAFAQFRQRALPAVMVPLFLVVLLAVAHGLLVWFPMFVSSVPYAGGLLYALLYPLGFAAALFGILLGIAVLFSMFVFPAIIAVRRHGWFDNVVDTIEAVGTRPHILVASLALSFTFIVISYNLTQAAGSYLRTAAASQQTWGAESHRSDPSRVEDRAQEISVRALRWADPVVAAKSQIQDMTRGLQFNLGFDQGYGRQETDGFYRWGSGLIAGFWQTVIGALVLGYCLNLFIGGGMLTYLLVREDDYWDDEDLEDLDKLAKELEEEAKREEAGAAAPASAAPAAPAPVPAAPAKTDDDGNATLPTQIVAPKG